jgi:hypothetical protein
MPDPSIDEVDKDEWDALTSAEQTDIREQVEDGSSTAWTQLADGKKNELIREAIGERDTLYSGDMSRLPTLDGDAEVFTLNLARHKWELAEGGEAQSESGEGGSTSYNTGGAGEDYLQQTRFGKTALRHVWKDSSIAAVRTY